jgi:organic radical activating enzyme
MISMPDEPGAEHREFARELGVQSLEELDRFPKYLQIETISGCNARCVMCSVESWTRTKAVMSDRLFGKIVDEVRGHSDWIERVIVQLDGEPLLDKRLENRIRAMKSAGMRKVSFATNGSLMTEARAASIIDAGVDSIDFSIDGATAETFEAIRIRLSFDTVRDNVLRFLELRDRMRPEIIVRVRMAIQPSNAQEFKSFVEFWRARLSPNDTVFGKPVQEWSTWERDVGHLDGLAIRTLPPNLDFNSLPCVSPFDSVVILSDGRVPLCCLDYNAETPMGDVNESSIAEVWNGEAFRRVRGLHLANGRRSMATCTDCHNYVPGINISHAGSRQPLTALSATDQA